MRLLFSVALLLLLGSACRLAPWPPASAGDAAVPSRMRVGVRTAPVTRGEITSLLVYPGELRPKAGAVVTARVAGRLDRLLVEPGSPVRAGDTLAELDRSALEV